MANSIDIKNKNDYIVGIVGGMGSYATADFFKRLLDAIPAEKEWDRPRIIVDNYCTMPSRVRALLYNERYDELVDDLSSIVENMLRLKTTRIVFACNTSHCFIPPVLEKLPEANGKILHIIDECGKTIQSSGITSVGLIATEGTIDTGIYSKTFEPYGISVTAPSEAEYSQLRDFIEAVKQDNVDDAICKKFEDFIEAFDEDAVILGCTELPVLYAECKKRGFQTPKRIFDPLQSVIDIIVSEYGALN